MYKAAAGKTWYTVLEQTFFNKYNKEYTLEYKG